MEFSKADVYPDPRPNFNWWDNSPAMPERFWDIFHRRHQLWPQGFHPPHN